MNRKFIAFILTIVMIITSMTFINAADTHLDDNQCECEECLRSSCYKSVSANVTYWTIEYYNGQMGTNGYDNYPSTYYNGLLHGEPYTHFHSGTLSTTVNTIDTSTPSSIIEGYDEIHGHYIRRNYCGTVTHYGYLTCTATMK